MWLSLQLMSESGYRVIAAFAEGVTSAYSPATQQAAFE